MEGQMERVRKKRKEKRMATHPNKTIGKDEETPHFHFPTKKGMEIDLKDWLRKLIESIAPH